MTQQPDRVRQFLRRQGCSGSVVKGGLDGLLGHWESVVEAIAAGYDLTLHDYRHDMDVRDLLRGAVEVAYGEERQRADRRLQDVDGRFRELTVECGPVWGEDVAEEHGHDPDDQWWYFRRPKQPGPDFEEELREAGFV
jgi:hypothetical protein